MEKISFVKREKCCICNTKMSNPIISLPKFPLTEIFVKEKPLNVSGFLDQSFHICTICGHGQLSRVVDKKLLYSSSAYFFRTSSSSSAVSCNDRFVNFIQKVIAKKLFSSIVEIGCSDLYLQKKLSSVGDLFVGVDPVLKGKENEFESEKIKLFGDFYERVADKISLDNALVISSHTLEHVENPRSLLESMVNLGDENTVYIHQFPSLEYLIDDARFDQIFHQHLNYFSLNSIKKLLFDIGAELIDFSFDPLHWGSLQIAFKKSTSNNTSINISSNELILYGEARVRKQFIYFTNMMDFVANQINDVKGPLFIFGAALMLPILSYYLKNDFSSVRAIVDDDSSKEGLFYSNLLTPISIPDHFSFEDATIIIGVLNHSRRVMQRVVSLNPKKIILPIISM